MLRITAKWLADHTERHLEMVVGYVGLCQRKGHTVTICDHNEKEMSL